MEALEAEKRRLHLTTNLHYAHFWQVNIFLPVLSDNTNQSHNFPNSNFFGCYVSVKSKLQHAPPGIPRAFDTFAVPGRREFDYQSLSGGGELHPRFHVKSLAWRAMGDAVLEDFRGKDCAFVANWLRGKGLNKLCGIFEVFKF